MVYFCASWTIQNCHFHWKHCYAQETEVLSSSWPLLPLMYEMIYMGKLPSTLSLVIQNLPLGINESTATFPPALPPPRTSEDRLHSTDTQSLSSLGQKQQHRQCKFLHNCCKKAAACTVPSKAFGYAAATSACTSAPLSLAGPLKNLSKYYAFY